MADEIKVILSLEDRKAIEALLRFDNAVKKTENTAVKGFTNISKTFGTFAGTLGAIGVAKGIQLIGRAFAGTITNAIEFSKTIAEINSLLPETDKLTQQTTSTLIRFSDQFSGTPTRQARAFYSIVSAGVRGTAQQLKVLEIANRAAVAGLVDVGKSAFALVSSVNAYKDSALTAEQASDALFVAVKEGQTTFGELADSIGVVAPIASKAGVSFSELAGTLAFVTKGGIDTRVATVGLRQVLVNVVGATAEAKTTAKELGIEFSTSAIKSKGFVAFLGDVITRTGGSEEKLSKLFGNVRALTPILQLAGKGFKDFERIIGETANAVGATDEAFKKIEKSAGFQIERLQQQLSNLPQSFLKNFDKPIADAIRSLREFISTKGMLGVIDAVDLTLSALNFLNGAFQTTSDTVDSVTASYNKLIIASLELKQLADQTAVSILPGDTSGIEATIFLRKEEIKALKEENAEIEKNKTQRAADTESRKQQLQELRQAIRDGRKAQVKDNEDATAKQKDDDRKIIESGKEKFDAQAELDLLNIDRKLTLAENEVLAKQLQSDQEFAILEQGLGRNQAAQVIADANKLAAEGDNNKARLLLRKAFNKAADAIDKQNVEAAKKRQAEFKSNLSSSLGSIATLQSSHSKELFRIGQAAAIANAVINTSEGVTKAWALGPILGPILAPLVAVAGAAQIATIASQKAPGMQDGGIVPGTSFAGDNQTIRANSGEIVFNRRQQENLFNAIDTGNIGGGGGMNLTIMGDILGEESMVDTLIDKINDGIEFRNLDLRAG